MENKFMLHVMVLVRMFQRGTAVNPGDVLFVVG